MGMSTSRVALATSRAGNVRALERRHLFAITVTRNVVSLPCSAREEKFETPCRPVVPLMAGRPGTHMGWTFAMAAEGRTDDRAGTHAADGEGYVFGVPMYKDFV
jgi:hypothetical protein